jgi:cobaltochelatase CobN
LFGQGLWGDQPQDAEAAREVFKMALKDVRAVLHPKSSNLYGTLDNDDVYQYLGGAAMAVRAVNGKTPETLLVDMSNPAAVRTETLDQSMGREMRTRYLNPKWINAMLDEGYSGARMIMQVHDNLWGWQVTVPEAVDAAKWQAMYETYVADRYKLDIRNRFRAANNMAAYQALIDRMLVAVNKGYWQADARTVKALNAANRAAISEAGVACSPDTCSSVAVIREAQRRDKQLAAAAATGFGLATPGTTAAVAPPARAAAPPPDAMQPVATPSPPAVKPPAPAPKPVLRGQQMQEKASAKRSEPPLRPEHGLVLLLLIAAGMAWQAFAGRRDRLDLQPA